MITFFSWLAFGFVVCQLLLIDAEKIRWSWYAAFAACAAWAVFAVATGAWALLLQQLVVTGIAVRALWKLRQKSS